ncbi:MAG: MFS transporter [Anaerolineae bacterium]|jgi:DHA3 family tetracycline resistance protein-like MFS transporter|nr:MFS transporter [Anaerolineae bacterium]
MFRPIDAYRVHLIQAALASLASATIFTTWMIYQIEVIGLNPLQLVLLGTALEVAIMVFEIPTGIVADLYSRRISVIIGFGIIGIAFLLIGLFPVFELALLGSALWGIGYTFTSGAYDAWLVDEVGQARTGQAFLRGSQISMSVSVVGIILSVTLGSLHLALPILIGAGIYLALTVLMVIVMPENGFNPTPQADRNTWQKMAHTFREGIAVIRTRPTLLSIIGVGIFFGLFSEGWDRLWQAHLLTNIGLPAIGNFEPIVWFGVIGVIDMFFGVIGTEIVRRRVDLNNPRAMTRVLLILTAVMVIAMIGYGLSVTFMIAISMYFTFVLARTLIGPILGTWTNANIDSNVRATVLSMQSQTDAIGQAVGGPPIGLVGNQSLRGAILMSALILSPALGLLARVYRRVPTQVETNET